MAKKTLTSIVEVWNWLVNDVLETGELSIYEQATLIHIIAKLNRNLWKPAKINPKIIAATLNIDQRTVTSAITRLTQRGILINSNGGIFIGINNDSTAAEDSGTNETNFRREPAGSQTTIETGKPRRQSRLFNQPSD